MTIADMSKDAITLADDLVGVDELLTDVYQFLERLENSPGYYELQAEIKPLLRRIEKY